MIGNSKWRLLREISRLYAPDILEALQNKPMRFTDLKRICRSQKTLTERLRSLEDCGAITTEVQKEKKHKVKVFYILTQKGKSAIALAQDMARLA